MRKLIVLLSLLVFCGAFRILLVFPMPFNSHSNLGEGYVRHLLRAGHEVTYITPVPGINQPKNLRQIDVSSIFALHSTRDLTKLIHKEPNKSHIAKMLQVMLEIAVGTVLHENTQKLINDPKEEFDVVIAEWMFSELYSGLAAVFNRPLIWSASMAPHALVLSLVDEPPDWACGSRWSSTIIQPLTFKERAVELWTSLCLKYNKWLMTFKEAPVYEQAYASAAVNRGRQLPPWTEVKYNGSLVLGNSHVSTWDVVSLPQWYKLIGGYHIEDIVKPLSPDLQNIMESSRDGVIYFSLGSALRSKSMPKKIKRGLLDVFGSLNQTVIWKLEETPKQLPKNVHVVSFAPQQSILAHPNCVLFITHGGLLSTTETIRYGVPVIGIPVFADQFINVDRSVKKGYGKRVDLDYNTPELLQIAVGEVINNPMYRENVKELSSVYHDRPLSPGQELVYWVEHVVKTRGAPHLRSPELMLPWYQKMCLDLLVLISIIVLISSILAIYISLRILKWILKHTYT